MVTGSIDFISIIVNPLLEIVLSLALGALMGWLLTQIEKRFNSNTNRLNMSIAFVLLTTALSMLEFDIGPVTISFSSLLVCMMLGTIFATSVRSPMKSWTRRTAEPTRSSLPFS